MRLVSSPPKSRRKSGAFTPAAQTTSSDGMNSPIASTTPSARTSRHARAGAHLDADGLQQVRRRGGDALRQRRQDARRRLDQHDVDVARGIDAVQAVGDDGAHRAVQFGGQFGAGGAGADDGDVELAGPHRLGLRVGAQAGVDQAPVEAAGLLRRLQRHRESRGAGRAEIVGDAADRHDQRVVGAARVAGVISRPSSSSHRRQLELFRRAVEADHLAEAVGEMVPMRLREVVQLVLRAAAGCRRRPSAAAASRDACGCARPA